MAFVPLLVIQGISMAIMLPAEFKWIGCFSDPKHATALTDGCPAPLNINTCPLAKQLCPMHDFERAIMLNYVFSFITVVYIWGLFGWNRGQLQDKLGHPSSSLLNFVLYAPVVSSFCGCCAMTQEARAVKARWIQNGMQDLGPPQMPIQPQAASVAYVQAAGVRTGY